MKVGRLRVKFIQVCEWFDGCDRLKIILKSRKNKITKLYLIFKIIKPRHNCDLDITLKPLHNRDDWKIEEFSSSCSSLSIKVDWQEREMMNSSELGCEVCVVQFKWIKGESGLI